MAAARAGLLVAAALAGLLALQPLPAAADSPGSGLAKRLAREMRKAGSYSGAYVYNLTDGQAAFGWRSRRGRVLASNTKLFTTAAALARYGADGRLPTEVLGTGFLGDDGTWRGDLYLRGGGDPTFGSRRFARRSYLSGASVETLAGRLQRAGILRVTGRIRGDESRFDSLRGGPYSAYRTSVYVGPLSALAYNRGLADERGFSFQSNPPAFAAARLDAALERRGITVRRTPAAGRTPDAARVIASVESPPMARLVEITSKRSDNFFAEMLLKSIGFEATGSGTTARGARVAARFARRLGSRVRMADGSGLSRGNRTSPWRTVRLLLALPDRTEFPAFFDSLPVAGRDGTLSDRMRRGPARGRCRGKTGTLSNVSALSGYCLARSGDTYAFSILMNGVYPAGARRLQDRMAQAIAGVRR